MIARASLVAMALASLGLSGCAQGPAAPKTYPVTGKVIYKGGAPLAGGAITLVSTADRSLRAIGEIANDGGFSLHTLVGNHKVSGTIEGTHDVHIIPAQDQKQRLPALRLVQRQCKVEPGGPNQLTIEVERVKS
jgi:hypothetical protein